MNGTNERPAVGSGGQGEATIGRVRHNHYSELYTCVSILYSNAVKITGGVGHGRS